MENYVRAELFDDNIQFSKRLINNGADGDN
jgi:hypothetical protein